MDSRLLWAHVLRGSYVYRCRQRRFNPFMTNHGTLAVRERLNLKAKTFVSVALILAVLTAFTYVPVHVTEETFTGSSTLPCHTTTTLVPFGTWTLYTLNWCACTIVQSQSYASRYVPTLTPGQCTQAPTLSDHRWHDRCHGSRCCSSFLWQYV